MTILVPVASGKGGVGKTTVCSNLGVALARAGKTVVLVDLDLGASNLHTFLGIPNKNPGIGNYIHKQQDSLESLIRPTQQDRLYFIPGDALLPGTANLPFFRKKKIIKELSGLVADFVLLDLGAGSAYNTVDFFLVSPGGILVCTPETTSILNAYSFLKTAVYRYLYRSFKPDSPERREIEQFGTARLEGNDQSFTSLPEQLSRISDTAGALCRNLLAQFSVRIILNMGKTQNDIAVGARLRSITRKNLGVEVEYIGFLPVDPTVPQSIARRAPALTLSPDGPFARGLGPVVKKIIGSPIPKEPVFYDDEDTDLQRLAEDFASPDPDVMFRAGRPVGE
jgi:flagellar biosynthesis protein FlhG